MGLSLRRIGKKIWETVTPQNEEALRRNEASNRAAAARIQARGNQGYGVLADPARRQQFTQEIQQPDKFSLAKAALKSFGETLTQPEQLQNAPKVNVGSWRGSGLVEDFINSPFRIAEGGVKIGQGRIKEGAGDIIAGAVEGPLGLMPIGKTAQVGFKGAGVLPKIKAGVKTGATEGGIYGSAYGAGEAMSENASPQEILKRGVATGAAGAAAGAGLGVAVPVAVAGAKAAGKSAVQLAADEAGSVRAPARIRSNPQAVPVETTNKNSVVGEFQRAIVDREAPIINMLKRVEKATGQEGLVDTFYYDTGLQRRSNAIANAKIEQSGNVKEAFAGLTGGKVFKGTKGQFDDYAAARNELVMANRGMQTSKPKEELEAIVNNGSPEFETRFKALNEEYKQAWKERFEAGIIDRKTYQAGISDPNYSRIQRDVSDLANPPRRSGNGYSLGSTSAKQKRVGSTRAVQPADQTLFNYRQEVQKEIQKNQTAGNLINVLEGQGIAREVSESKGKNTLSVFRDGKKYFYEVPKDIKEIADNVSPYQLGILAQVVAAPQRLLRAGATGLSVPFTLANYAKDLVSSGVLSKNAIDATSLGPNSTATHAPAHIASGLYNSAKAFGVETNDPLWQKFTAHLGDTTQYDFIRNAKNAKNLSREVRLGLPGKYVNMVKNPIRTLEDLNQITEKATRFQNFKGTYNKALAEGLSETEATQAATLAAWQNSVDFSRMGNVGQAINLLIPYFNAGIQGTRLLGRRLKEAPVGTTAKILTFVATPLAAATFFNMRDEKTKAIYENISDFEKENNIILVLPTAEQKSDGSYDGVIKIPIQPGLSNLVQPFRQGIENYSNVVDKNEFTEMAQQFVGAAAGPLETGSVSGFLGGLIPQAVKPSVQQAANKNFFTGKEIIPEYVEKATDAQGNPVPEEKKAYDHTSGSAKFIGQALNQSPIRVEKFIKDTSGKVGEYSQNAVDNALAKAGVIKPDEIGGISAKDDIIRRFAKASGEYNFKKSEGAKYFDDIKAVTKSLNGNEKAAYDTLHPDKKNFLGETIFDENKRVTAYARAGVYLQFPKVFEADKQLDKLQREKGKPGNPLYDLPKEQLTRILLKATLPPGSKDPELSNLWKEEWYQDYSNKRDSYYKSVKESMNSELAKAKTDGDKEKVAQLEKSLAPQANPYPETSPDLQKVMDEYNALPKGTGARSGWIKANAGLFEQMKNQWAAVDAWENKERVSLGLNPIAPEDQIGASSSSSYDKKGGGGGSGGSAGSEYKYAIDPDAGGAVAKPKVKSKATKAAKSSVGAKSSKPKVTIKRSQV